LSVIKAGPDAPTANTRMHDGAFGGEKRLFTSYGGQHAEISDTVLKGFVE
jgi:hypothetical protein